MISIIIILAIIILILGFATWNLLKKNEKCEDTILYYEKYISNFSQTIDTTSQKLKELDIKGSFESDDEVGFFFKEIKILQEKLNEFKA